MEVLNLIFVSTSILGIYLKCLVKRLDLTSNLIAAPISIRGCEGSFIPKNVCPGSPSRSLRKTMNNRFSLQTILGGGFKYFLFSPLLGEDFQFD